MKENNSRSTQAAITKAAFLKSAYILFTKKGYKNTSVREIGRNAGLANGLLYHYFPGGKKELFQAVIENAVIEMIQGFQSKNTMEKLINMSLSDMLRWFLLTINQLISNHADIIRILINEKEMVEFLTKDQIEKIISVKTFGISDILKQKALNGEVKTMDYDIAALSLYSFFADRILHDIFNCNFSFENNKYMIDRIVKYYEQMWSI